ncbi:MAG: hypothetical protein M1453_10595 [Acidobacteria bacterium]|nr:hypothetical protein [Acidobacteriota bacterium]
MNTHPHLRAYLAGIALPTFLTPLGVCAFAIARFGFGVPIALERVAIFPLALLPFLWGAWNVLYFLLGERARLPFGFHGSLFFVIFGPLGYLLAGQVLDLSFLPHGFLGVVIPAGLLVYYLLWKYLVSYFNRVLGLA